MQRQKRYPGVGAASGGRSCPQETVKNSLSPVRLIENVFIFIRFVFITSLFRYFSLVFVTLSRSIRFIVQSSLRVFRYRPLRDSRKNVYTYPSFSSFSFLVRVGCSFASRVLAVVR